MALDDYIEPEVGVAVAITAALMSPKVRGVLRRGAVYGIAGVLMAGDGISALARGVKRGVTAADVAPVAADSTPSPIAETTEAGTESTDPGFAPEPEPVKVAPKTRTARVKTNSDSGDDANE